MDKINGKVVWVTGASSGIGEALVYYLNKKSCKIIISARRKSELQIVKNNCSDSKNIEILPLDLEVTENLNEITEKAMLLYGKVDILINNAGVSQRSLIKETSLGVYKRLMNVNYIGTIALTKSILPVFIKQNDGHFVTVTSLMGKFGSPYRSGYCGAKHALHGFFDVLRMEHEKDNIQVTLICPGFVQTNVSKNALVGNGSKQTTEDDATKNGLTTAICASRIIKAIEQNKFEVYIGKKEVLGVYLKRFFPKMLHKFVLKSKVR